jgi:biotin carboxylase
VTDPPRRLLLAADHRYASLGAVRALREGGYTPWVAATERGWYAARSRAAAGVVAVPDVRCDPDGFVAALVSAASSLEIAAVLPASEAALLALAGHQHMFPRTAVGVCAPGIVQRATDKVALLELAAEARLPLPPSVILTQPEIDRRGRDLRYPVIVKPVRSEMTAPDGSLRYESVRRVRSFEALSRAVEQVPGRKWVVQQYLPGILRAVCGVVWNGELVCAVHQVTHRTWPPDGPSAYAQTTAADPDLEQGVARLLGLVGWSGVFQAQFIESDGRNYLIDFNPRLYGSVSLAVFAGLNLPAIWANLLVGGAPAAGNYRVGVRYRCEERDLRALLAALAHGRVGVVVDGLVPRRRTVHAIFSRRDPLPAITSIAKLSRRLMTMPLRQRVRGASVSPPGSSASSPRQRRAWVSRRS